MADFSGRCVDPSLAHESYDASESRAQPPFAGCVGLSRNAPVELPPAPSLRPPHRRAPAPVRVAERRFGHPARSLIGAATALVAPHTSRPYAPKAFERAPDRVRRPRFSIQSNARALSRFHDVPRLVRCSRTAQSPMSVRSGSSPRREGIVIEVFRIERRGAGRALRRSRCVMCVPCPVVACMLRNCGKFKL